MVFRLFLVMLVLAWHVGYKIQILKATASVQARAGRR